MSDQVNDDDMTPWCVVFVCVPAILLGLYGIFVCVPNLWSECRRDHTIEYCYATLF